MTHRSQVKRSLLSRWGLALPVIGLLLTGCSTQTTETIDFEAEAMDLNFTIEAIIAQQEPVTGPISLYEAMARALKYNLDEKIELLDEEFRRKQTEAIKLGMYPSLITTLGYSQRNNDAGSSSRSLLTGDESLEVSSSSERNNINGRLEASWNLLDFGVAYYQSQQNQDEQSIAAERRRKVINRILEDVRTAYWRAVSAERTHSKLVKLEALTRETLRQAEQLEERRLAPPLQVLNYQRDLLRVQSNVQRMQRELLLSKKQLAALINLKPNTLFHLELPDRTNVVPELPGSAYQMIILALQFRSELRESYYRKQINRKEVDSLFWRSIPGFNLIVGLNYDSNDYLFNNDWLNISAQSTWNMLELFRYPLQKEALEAELAVITARENALVMAIMTQVHVARARFIQLSNELNTIRAIHDVQEKIVNYTRNGFRVKMISQRDLVQEELSTILSEVQYDSAYADLQNAFANLYASMGIDNFNFDLSSDKTVAEITEELRQHWTERAISLPSVPEISEE
jgi:outer membrane protein TolC